MDAASQPTNVGDGDEFRTVMGVDGSIGSASQHNANHAHGPVPHHVQRDLTPLEEIDEVIEEFEEHRAQVMADAARRGVDSEAFDRHADETIDRVIRPTMQRVAWRLRRDGADGRIVEAPSDARHTRRLTFWMSLDGAVADPPRQDRNPFLQIDVDVPNRRIKVWEGDMWEGRGTSRSTAPWHLDEITVDMVSGRIVGILRRAVDREEAT